MSSAKRNPVISLVTLVALAILLSASSPLLRAQDDEAAIHVNSAKNAPYTYSKVHYHILPANTVAGHAALAAHELGTKPPKKRFLATIPLVPAPGFYPDDLDFFGGPVVTSMESHNVYLNASSSPCKTVAKCWGNPEQFLTDLGMSTFIHVTDQYTGVSGTYTNGAHVNATFPIPTGVIDQSDLFGIVHDAAVKLGTPSGYGHEYHVFLPPGVDTCFDLSAVCYSPDNPSSFYFCAYHGSVTFSDIGHVLFSIQPDQNVPGCQAAPPNPNSELIDSTNSVLSHETIETITDPDINAWIADESLVASGDEIGDLCEPTGNNNGQFLDPTVTLNGHKYEIQLEYSNHYHACAPK